MSSSNYFEAAYALTKHENTGVRAVASSLYTCMCVEFQNTGFAPIGDFNILYFFKSAAEYVLGSQLDLIQCASIEAILDPNQKSSDVAAEYSSIVLRDSVSCGKPFDLGYATRILELALPKIESAPLMGIDESPGPDWDEWLAGFNAKT